MPADSARRALLFRESAAEKIRRHVLGLAWALKPERAPGLPVLWGRWLTSLGRAKLPDPERALARPHGFAGFVKDLSVPTLIAAYGSGLYPFAHLGPLKWWSPPERAVVPVRDLHVSRRIRSRMRQNRLKVTFDADFEAVIRACARPREGKVPLTWITPRIMRAYAELFDAGIAHSFEVRTEGGDLVGGGYGVAAGGVFVIESQFAWEPGASQIGFAVLSCHLAEWGFVLLDNKLMTPTVERMGFRNIPRSAYLATLASPRDIGRPGRWQAVMDTKEAEAALRSPAAAGAAAATSEEA